MKKYLTIIFLLVGCDFFGQDVIHKINGIAFEASVISISENNISYKKLNDLSEVVYSINRRDVSYIEYKNGSVEYFKDTNENKKQEIYLGDDSISESFKAKQKLEHYEQVSKNKNALFLNTLEFFNSGISVSYFREFCDNMLTVQLPFAFSLGNPNMSNATIPDPSFLDFSGDKEISDYKYTQKNFETGLGLYINTSRKRAITHFVGPMIRFAQFSGTYNYNAYVYNYSNSFFGLFPEVIKVSSQEKRFVINETSLMLNNGFLYRITPHFSMMMNIAMGTFIKSNYRSNDPAFYARDNTAIGHTRRIAFQLGFSLGYRFSGENFKSKPNS